MRAILIFLLLPCWTIGQEFYPGSIYNIDSPICYNNTATLGFEANPYDENSNYSYQWQKSWDGANWFNIPNANSTIYITDSLFIDTYYRAIVSANNISMPTNQIVVYVLPELQPGLLSQPDSICVYDEFILDFEIGASGAEWSWGGFLEFFSVHHPRTVVECLGKGPDEKLVAGNENRPEPPPSALLHMWSSRPAQIAIAAA